MMKVKNLAIIAGLLLPLSANADVEKIWPESIFLDLPIGAPGFPTILSLEPNYISFTNDAMNVVVSTRHDLVAADYTLNPNNTFRFNMDGMVNRVGTDADESFISGDGTIVAIEEAGGGNLKRVTADGTIEMSLLATQAEYFSLDNAAGKVAYENGGDLYSANIDGSNVVMLHDGTTTPDSKINVVQISGDGTKVTFAINPDFNANTPDPPELFVVDIDGMNKLQLTDGAGDGATAGNNDMIRGASISDDGSVLVFVKTWSPGVTMINADGTNEVKLFSMEAEFPKISGDGSTVAFLTSVASPNLGSGSDTGYLTPYSFAVASPSAITAHVPFGLGVERNVDVEWIGISQNGEYVFYTAAEDYFSGDLTSDFRDLYFYRSTGTVAVGSTGTIPGGIGTESNADVTSVDRSVIALLLLALAASLIRGMRASRRQTVRSRR